MTLAKDCKSSSATWPLGHLATRAGTVYVEYFVLATIVALATIAFWRGGFVRARGSVEGAFDASVNRVLAP